MVKLPEFEQRKRAADLLLDVRETYIMLDVFGAMLQDRGDDELAARIFRVKNTVADCCGFINDFMENLSAVEKAVVSVIKQNGRQENSNDN